MFDSSDLNGQAGLLEPDDSLNSDSIWTCKDGRRIPIGQMGNDHLLRTIRVLRGKSPIGTKFKTSPERRRKWLNAMANEAYERGLQIDPLTEEEQADSHE